MQFDSRHRDEILAGKVTVTFRRWTRRQAVPDNVYRTSLGRIQVDSVDVVEPSEVTHTDARLAGYDSVPALLDAIGGDEARPLHRVRFHVLHEADPRAVLAATDDLSDEDRAEIDRRLHRLDRSSSTGPWTCATLELIAERPGVRAPDLAASLGRAVQPFKTDVRKLKNLGLTESLAVGYRISPRGRAYLGGVGRSG